MTPHLSQLLVSVDRAAVEREADELREQLRDCEALLRLIDRHGGSQEAADAQPAPVEPAANANGTNGNGHKRLSEKREAVMAILRERPGRWTTADMRSALTERDIDPLAGTPVKNILWQMAKDGTVHASGGGVYEFPALNVSVEEADEQGVLAA